MERAHDAALEDREEGFDRVGGLAVLADVLVLGVVHRTMLLELTTEPVVDEAVVGVQLALAAGVGDEELTDILRRDVGDVLGANLAATLDQGNDGMLFRSRLAVVRVLKLCRRRRFRQLPRSCRRRRSGQRPSPGRETWPHGCGAS